MKIEDMENLILILKEFKNELDTSEDKRDVNKILRMINNTMSEKQYYS